TGNNFDWATQIVKYIFVPGPLVTAPALQSAVEGTSQSFSLGNLMDSSQGPWTVGIDWGDNSSDLFSQGTTGTIPAETHTYSDDGSYTVVVTVTNSNSMLSASRNFQVNVAGAGSPTITLLQNFANINFNQTATGFTDLAVD